MSITTTKDDLMNSLMTTTTMGTTTNGFGNGGVGGTDNDETHNNIVSPPETITGPSVGTEASSATGEEDLFGGIPIVDTGIVVTGSEQQLLQSQPPPLPPTTLPPPPPPPAPLKPPPAPSAVSGLFGSLLMDSTSIAGASGGGGLFDDIDQAEEAAAQKAKEEAAAAAAATVAAQVEAQQAAATAQAQAQQQQAAAAAAAAHAAEAQQRAAAEEEVERVRRQQVQDQMQSIHLGNATGPVLSPSSTMYGGGGTAGMAQPPPPPYYNTNPSHVPVGFPPPAPQQPQGYNINNTNMYSQPQPPPPQQQQYPYQQAQPPMYPPAQQQDGSINNSMPPPQLQPQQRQPQQQQQISDFQQQPRHYQPTVMGNPTAGMYNGGVNSNNNNMMFQPQQPTQIPNHQMYMQQQQRTVMTVPMGYYYRILVTEPLLVQSPNHGGGLSIFGIGGSTPHWSYQITTELNNMQQQQPTSPSNQSSSPQNTGGGGGVWMVRRRFRHVVALEDRLREDCPGAILPPRPEKHVSRAIEEVGAHQSAEFAMQRALELQNYLNLLIHHPYAQQSPVLRLFLYNQDDLGTTWPEVSNNAFTRLANASVGAAVKVSESTAGTKLPWHDQGMIDDFGEDNAELIALQNGESIRMGAVLQAVPKLEGAATLLREHTELTLSVAMEFSRIAKDLEITDRELYQPIDLVSAGMLRAGRRSKRLVMELSAAVQSYSNQYKLCRYERMAFADRKNAIIRRQKERGRADHRAAQLLFHQRQQHHLSGSQQYYGNNNMNNMDRMAQDAAMMDDFATDVNQECEEIGRRLKQEVNRITWNRKIEWNASVKVIASAMKEAATERVAIWETIRESFVKAYPEYAAPTLIVEPNGAAINPMEQSQQQSVDTTSSFMNNPITPSPLGY